MIAVIFFNSRELYLYIKYGKMKMENRHVFWMIIGCGLPLLLIFFAPALGLSSGISLLIFVLIMFGCHLLMPMGHRSHDQGDQENKSITNMHHHESH